MPVARNVVVIIHITLSTSPLTHVSDCQSGYMQAPGTVYGNTWEKRKTDAVELRVVPVPDYQPPFEINPANPQCFMVSERTAVLRALARSAFQIVLLFCI